MKLPRPLTGVIVAAAMLAAACGSETTAPALETAAVDATSSSEAQTAESEAEPAAESEGPETEPAAESEGPETEPAAEEAEAPAEVSNHLFPDLETVNIKDGSSLNLASELAGGDKPVLLWFYAPH